jgi:cell division septation protein DedD
MAAENDLPDNDDVKKKALMRLTVAGLITAAALAALWWLDQGNKGPSEKMAQKQQPAPIRAAPAPEPAPPQAEAASEPPLEPAAAPGELPAPKEPPPPPEVNNMPRPVQPHEIPPPPATVPHPVAAAPSTSTTIQEAGFVVQLGVFANPENALELVHRLKQKGVRARTETRVYVGPFLNHEEAAKAQGELHRLGMKAVVTTATATQ